MVGRADAGRGPDGAGCQARRASFQSYVEAARARGCAIVLFAVCARFIGAEGVIKLCDMLLKFDTRRYASRNPK